MQGKIPLYTVFTVDSIGLPKFQKAGFKGVLGSLMTMTWAPTMDNPQNKKFVSAFKKKYGGYPSFYAAQAYDSIYLIKSAVEAVNGDLSKKDEMRAAMRSANFPSVRGKFTYGKNGMPIQNIYLRTVAADADGVWTTKIVQTVYKDLVDPYAKDCKLK